VTEHEIDQRVDRMLDHLNRLLLNGDMSEDDYHAAIMELVEWEEEALLKAKEVNDRQRNTNDANLNLKP
jgi:hypothetical protein